LTLTAAPFGRPGMRNATVVIVAGLERQAALSARDLVRVAVRAFDQSTALRDAKGVGTATVQLTPRADGRDTSFDIPTTLDLAPGRYEIRLAMESSLVSARGSAFMSVTVPDFAKDALALSGLVLATTPAARLTGRDLLSDLLPFVPTTRRMFGSRETVHAAFSVYQGGKRTAVPVRVAAQILDRNNRRVFDRFVVLPSTAFVTTGRIAQSSVTLPLTALSTGPHLLTIEVDDGTTTVERHVRFTVE
jgi:hypothetical protein